MQHVNMSRSYNNHYFPSTPSINLQYPNMIGYQNSNKNDNLVNNPNSSYTQARGNGEMSIHHEGGFRYKVKRPDAKPKEHVIPLPPLNEEPREKSQRSQNMIDLVKDANHKNQSKELRKKKRAIDQEAESYFSILENIEKKSKTHNKKSEKTKRIKKSKRKMMTPRKENRGTIDTILENLSKSENKKKRHKKRSPGFLFTNVRNKSAQKPKNKPFSEQMKLKNHEISFNKGSTSENSSNSSLNRPILEKKPGKKLGGTQSEDSMRSFMKTKTGNNSPESKQKKNTPSFKEKLFEEDKHKTMSLSLNNKKANKPKKKKEKEKKEKKYLKVSMFDSQKLNKERLQQKNLQKADNSDNTILDFFNKKDYHSQQRKPIKPKKKRHPITNLEEPCEAKVNKPDPKYKGNFLIPNEALNMSFKKINDSPSMTNSESSEELLFHPTTNKTPKFSQPHEPRKSLLSSLQNPKFPNLFTLSRHLHSYTELQKCKKFSFSHFKEYSEYVCTLSCDLEDATFRGLFFVECCLLASQNIFSENFGHNELSQLSRIEEHSQLTSKNFIKQAFFCFCCGFFFRSILHLERFFEKHGVDPQIFGMTPSNKRQMVKHLIIYFLSFCAPVNINDENAFVQFIFSLKIMLEGFKESEDSIFSQSLFEESESSFGVFYKEYWKGIRKEFKRKMSYSEVKGLSVKICKAFGGNLKRILLKDDESSSVIIRKIIKRLKIKDTPFDS